MDPAEIQEILKLVERFGFKFFGYDENNRTLVVAPNGQIVFLEVAYSFIKSQMAKATSSSGGMEAIPQMPSMNFEAPSFSPEKEKSIETAEKAESSTNQAKQTSASSNPASVIPKAAAKPMDPAFGDTQKITINPRDVKKAEEFINKNSRKSNSDPKTWLSAMFEKFLYENGLK